MDYKYSPTHEADHGIVRQLWRGDVRLPITYWVFGALVGLAVGLAYMVIEFNYMKIANSSFGPFLLLFLAIIVIIHQMFWSIATWRSARKYNGSRVWSVLARVAVVIGVIQIIVAVPNLLGVGSQDRSEIEEEIALSNKSSPSMVDTSTRLDGVTLSGGTIIYNLTIIDLAKDEFDRDSFEAVMGAQVKTTTCEKNREILDGVDRVSYLYRDKNGAAFARLDVSKEDCI
jgi:hypothetical protein